MYNVLYIVCCNANSPRWYMELFSIESVCLVDYISNFLYLTPVLSNIINKGTSQQVTVFVNVHNVSRFTAVHDSLQGHT